MMLLTLETLWLAVLVLRKRPLYAQQSVNAIQL
jgi:hypothetical protein